LEKFITISSKLNQLHKLISGKSVDILPTNLENFHITIFSCGSYYKIYDDTIQHIKHTIRTVNSALPKENKASYVACKQTCCDSGKEITS